MNFSNKYLVDFPRTLRTYSTNLQFNILLRIVIFQSAQKKNDSALHIQAHLVQQVAQCAVRSVYSRRSFQENHAHAVTVIIYTNVRSFV